MWAMRPGTYVIDELYREIGIPLYPKLAFQLADSDERVDLGVITIEFTNGVMVSDLKLRDYEDKDSL